MSFTVRPPQRNDKVERVIEAHKVLMAEVDGPKANDIQHGGDHYKSRSIEPWDYVAANGLCFFTGNAVKYLTRWKDKGGVQDLKKAKHYIDKLIEIEQAKDGK